MLAQVDPAELERRATVVEQLFKDQLSLEPHNKGRAYTTYLVPRDRESDLIPFLGLLEKRSEELGVTDIQLSLTSLVSAPPWPTARFHSAQPAHRPRPTVVPPSRSRLRRRRCS